MVTASDRPLGRAVCRGRFGIARFDVAGQPCGENGRVGEGVGVVAFGVGVRVALAGDPFFLRRHRSIYNLRGRLPGAAPSSRVSTGYLGRHPSNLTFVVLGLGCRFH